MAVFVKSSELSIEKDYFGYAFYLRCEEIWRNQSISQAFSPKDRTLVFVVATRMKKLQTNYVKHKTNLDTVLKKNQRTYEDFRVLPEETRKQLGVYTNKIFQALEQMLPALGILTDPEVLTYVLDSSSRHSKRLAARLDAPVSINKATLLDLEDFMVQNFTPEEQVSSSIIWRLFNCLNRDDPIQEGNREARLTALVDKQLGDVGTKAGELAREFDERAPSNFSPPLSRGGSETFDLQEPSSPSWKSYKRSFGLTRGRQSGGNQRKLSRTNSAPIPRTHSTTEEPSSDQTDDDESWSGRTRSVRSISNLNEAKKRPLATSGKGGLGPSYKTRGSKPKASEPQRRSDRLAGKRASLL